VSKREFPDRGRWESRRATAIRSQRTPVDDVTEEQYQRGWDLISTGHSIGQILVATGLTRPQLDYLTRAGHPKLALEGYTQRLAEISAQIRKRARDAADAIGLGALDALRREVDMVKVASTLAGNLLKAHIQHVVLPAQQRLASGTGTPEDEVAVMALPPAIRETLKVLKDYTRLEPTARMFRTVFDSPHAMADSTNGTQVARIDLSAEKALPAAFAIVEDIQDSANPAATDPLDMLPGWEGWTLEEIEAYLANQTIPEHAYGDTRVVEDLPDECLEQSPDDF
jgi:hypothetical protein